jgi:hypothetical protein
MYVCVSMALKKATKRIIFSDESINSKNFWVLNDGIDVSVYANNPILLFNHVRADKNDKNQILPIGCMLELKRETDGSWSGLPAFDDTDAFALSIYEKYEAGIINMASSGLKPIEVLGDGKFLKLKDGIKAPCLSKCALKEISLVDIASNDNAIKLYNNDDVIDVQNGEELLKLFIDTTKIKIEDMLQLKDVAVVLQLAETATTEQILEAVKKQNQEVVQLKADNVKVTGELVELKAAAVTEKITSLVQKACDDKKITDAEKPHFVKLATADFDSVTALLAGMKPYQSIETTLSDEGAVNQVELASLITLSGDQLFEDGKLDRLKELSLVHYKLKYKEAFGVEPEAEKK